MANTVLALAPLIFLLCFIFTLDATIAAGSNNPHDKQALIALRNSLQSHNSNLSTILYNWGGGSVANNTQQDVCKWARVQCDNIGNVVSLNLSHAQLQGPIPSNTFSSLQHLSQLILSFNNFSQNIPLGLSNCTNLEVLDLSHNSLTSNIPPQLGSLWNLHQLDLSSNNFYGGINFVTLKNMSYLWYLNLSNNALTWNVPYGQLPSLSVLDLSNNKFNGSLPSNSIGEMMPNLQVFHVGNNQLSGVIPLSFFSKCGLRLFDIDLGQNFFWGTIPTTIGNCTRLKSLRMTGNLLNGVVAIEIAKIQTLERLELGTNFIAGIPFELSDLGKLKYLDLSNNLMGGGVPYFLGKFTSLEHLALNDNKLSGFLYGWMVEALENLKFLDLSRNLLEGSIPVRELGVLPKLEELRLAENQFSDGIPAGIRGPALQTLDLSKNLLNGSIDANILAGLVSVDFSSNAFSGEIPALPQNLSGASSLSSLNLSFNPEITGRIAGKLQQFPASSYLGDPKLCFDDGVARQPPYEGAIIPSPCTAAANGSESPGDFLGSNKHLTIGIFSSAGALLILGVLLLLCRTCCRRRRRDLRRKTLRKKRSTLSSACSEELLLLETDFKSPDLRWVTELFEAGGKRRDWLSYADVEWATCNFHDKYVMGRSHGGAVRVFKANLGGTVALAVKRMALDFEHSNGNGRKPVTREDFLSHVRHMATLKHPNLLPILGIFHQGRQHLVLLKFMHNGSLAEVLDQLHNDNGSSLHLDWLRRLHVVSNVASALAFLHERGHVHGGIKPNNILIDRQFNAFIGDCGMSGFAPLLGEGPSSEYAAPEVDDVTGATMASDIFSYGVVLLEIATWPSAVAPHGRAQSGGAWRGQGAILVKWVRSAMERKPPEELLDPALRSSCADMRDAMRLLHVGLACTQDDPLRRPTMDKVAQALQELTSVEEQRLPCVYASSA